MQFNAEEALPTLAERFAASANVKNVFGEAIEAHGKTIIPVARVCYVMGAGGGGENKAEPEDAKGGSGGGGGVSAVPVGVLEVTDAGARFVRFFDPQMAAARLIAGGILFAFSCGGCLAAKKSTLRSKGPVRGRHPGERPRG